MIISEVTMSYPCLRYKVEVSHFTARKSQRLSGLSLKQSTSVTHSHSTLTFQFLCSLSRFLLFLMQIY